MYVPIFIVLAVLITRLLPLAGDSSGLALVANLTPLMALMVCGAAFFERRWVALSLPLGAFLVSDMVLNAAHGAAILGSNTLVALAIYVPAVLIGMGMRNGKQGFLPMMGATVAGVLAFYLVTNTASFFMFPGYPKSFQGWVQCMTVGIPNYPPTWSFLLKSLVGNTVFAAIFCYVFAPRDAHLPASSGVVISQEEADKSVTAS